jgi:hypothetical protein
MAKNISNIQTSDTFQQWLDKTNEISTAFRTDVITTGSGDSAAQGNAQITGNFTAATFLGDVQTDALSSETASATIQVNSPIKVNGASQTTATFSNGTGGQIEFTNGSLTWDVGLKDSGGNFIINTGAGADKLSLTSAGTLTVPNLAVTEDVVVTEDVTANNFIGDGSQLTGVISSVAVNELSDVTITNVQNGQVLKYNSSSGLWVNDTDFDSGLNASTLDNLDSTDFLRSNANDTYTGTLTVTGNINQTGALTVTGNIQATGDIITAYVASDLRLKDNLKVIQNPLDKISQINGYMFNYKDKPSETIPGVVAQEVEEILPTVVFNHERNGETYKAVRYEQLIPLLLESIKELKEKVNDLENQLNS